MAVTCRTDLPSGSLARIAAYATELAAELRQTAPAEEWVLNLTGGNKLMTLAFWQSLGPVVGKMLYTDTANACLEEWTWPDCAAAVSRPLESVLDLPLYLEAQGLRLLQVRSADPEWRTRVQARCVLTKYLAKNSRWLEGFLGQINHMASQALDASGETLETPSQTFNTKPRGSWIRAVKQIQQSGLAHRDGELGLEFRDVEAARYLNGGWLEEYAWQEAQELHPDALGLGVEGEWEDTRRGRNEFDVVLVHRNRLLLIECKTLRMGRDHEKDTQMLYKLDSLGEDVKSLFGEVVLLSARTPSEAVRDRAAHHRIQVVGPDRLPKLQRDLRDWMEQGRFPRS